MSLSVPLRILFAEDEDTYRLSVKKALSDFGYEVTTVESGEEAVLALDRGQFDVIILDYKMSGMSGLNVLQHMHEQKDETPVIVLTGAGSENIAVEVLKLGAYDYIRKDYLELRHLPIIVNGVRERFLFRKQKEHQALATHDRQQILELFASFQSAIGSLAHVVNNSLSLVSLNIHEYAQSLIPHVDESEREKFCAAFQELDKEFRLIASSVKMMLSLTSAMRDKLATASETHLARQAFKEELESLKKEFEGRMQP